jgi:hypothetical protein
MAELEKIGEMLRRVEFNPYPEVNADLKVPIENGMTRVCMTRPEYDLWLKVQQAFGGIRNTMQELVYYVNTYGGVVLAYQEIEIAAADLVETTVADDTLVTASQSDVEFNWKDPRLQWGRSINLEPALGVEQMGFVMDTGAHINPAVLHEVLGDGTINHLLQMDCVTPVPDSETQLQRRQWSNAGGVWDLRAKAWEVGQKLHLAQLRVMEATELA